MLFTALFPRSNCIHLSEHRGFFPEARNLSRSSISIGFPQISHRMGFGLIAGSPSSLSWLTTRLRERVGSLACIVRSCYSRNFVLNTSVPSKLWTKRARQSLVSAGGLIFKGTPRRSISGFVMLWQMHRRDLIWRRSLPLRESKRRRKYAVSPTFQSMEGYGFSPFPQVYMRCCSRRSEFVTHQHGAGVFAW